MAEKITVPTLGESVTEATVSKWLKSQGEKVIADEPLVELETDKVNVEVPSPTSGVLGNIVVKEGETVNVGSLLGTVDNSTQEKEKNTNEISNYSPPKKEEKDKKPKIFNEEKIEKPKKNKPKKIEEPVLKLEDEEPLILEEVHEESAVQKVEKKISPAARKMAIESNVDLNKIEGSGKNGIVLKEDIMALMGSKPAPSERKINHGPEERVKMTRLRLTIAKRLKEAQENAAMLTTFNEVDMSEVISMRSAYKDEFQNKYGVKLQLDPTFQPHLNLYEGIVFQLIGDNGKNKSVIAKGGRYDELVRSFSPNEKIFNGIGFTISVDILRNLIKEEKTDKKRILLMFKDSYLLEKGMNEQKVQQRKGNIAVLHLNPCDDLAKANQIMKENNCSEILWVK